VLGKFSLNITNVPQAFANNAENKNFTTYFFKAIKQFISMASFKKKIFYYFFLNNTK